MANFRANGGASQFKQLFTNAQPEMLQESRASLENEPKQLTDGGRSNQKLLGDGGVREIIESGRLLPERSSVGNQKAIELPSPQKGKITDDLGEVNARLEKALSGDKPTEMEIRVS